MMFLCWLERASPNMCIFIMVGHVTSSEIHADGQLEIGNVGVAPHLLQSKGGIIRDPQLRQSEPTAGVGPRAAAARSW